MKKRKVHRLGPAYGPPAHEYYNFYKPRYSKCKRRRIKHLSPSNRKEYKQFIRNPPKFVHPYIKEKIKNLSDQYDRYQTLLNNQMKRYRDGEIDSNTKFISQVLILHPMDQISEAIQYYKRLLPTTTPTTDSTQNPNRLTDEQIGQAKQVPIIDLLPAGSAPHTTSLSPSIRCPLPDHEDKSPSAKVYDDTNSFYCFGCKTGGDTIDLVQHLHPDYSFKEAVNHLLSI